MIIFLMGCHGVGKTTTINSLKLDLPLAKFTDVDLFYTKSFGCIDQLRRHSGFAKILEDLPTNINCIVDRSYLDHIVYGQVVVENQKEYDIAESSYLNTLNKIVPRLPPHINIYVYDEQESIYTKIMQRSRKGMNEEDKTFMNNVITGYDSVYGYSHGWSVVRGIYADYTKYNIPAIMKVHITDLEKTLFKLLV